MVVNGVTFSSHKLHQERCQIMSHSSHEHIVSSCSCFCLFCQANGISNAHQCFCWWTAYSAALKEVMVSPQFSTLLKSAEHNCLDGTKHWPIQLKWGPGECLALCSLFELCQVCKVNQPMSLCVFVCLKFPLLGGMIAVTCLRGAVPLHPTLLAQWCGMRLSSVGTSNFGTSATHKHIT